MRGLRNFAPIALLLVIIHSVHGAASELKIPETQEGKPGDLVQVAYKLDENGSPKLVELPVVQEFLVVEMPENDPRSIPHLTVPDSPITPATMLKELSNQTNVQFRSQVPLPSDQEASLKLKSPRFWEAEQAAEMAGNFQTTYYSDDGPGMLTIVPFSQPKRARTSISPWGMVNLETVSRTTTITPPGSNFSEYIAIQGRFRPDPSILAAMLYPVRNWVNGKWLPMPDSGISIIDSPGGGNFSFTVLNSLRVKNELPIIKCSLPVKLVRRMQTAELILEESDNVVIEIDGLVVHFFDLHRDGNNIRLKYGMIRQPDQSKEDFQKRVDTYEPWIHRLQVSTDGTKWLPLTIEGGRSSNGKFAVMDMSATDLPGNNKVKLHWEVPSVTQMADVQFTFEHLEVP